jgi:hypothetical protein
MSQQKREHLPEDFDACWYGELYPDLEGMDKCALEEHYLSFGVWEGRIYKLSLPLGFESSVYRIKNPDLANLSDRELEIHYSSFGLKEGREYSDRLFDPLFFKQKNKVTCDNLYEFYARDIRQIKSQEVQDILTSVKIKKVDVILVNHNSTINGATHSLYIMANELKKTKKILILDVVAQPEEIYAKYGLTVSDFVYYFADPTILYWLCVKVAADKILVNSTNFAISQAIKWLPKNKTILFSREIKEHYSKSIPYAPDYVITDSIAKTYKNKPRVQSPILPKFLQTSMDLDYSGNVDIPGLNSSKITIGMCGGFGVRKNTQMFLDVAEKLAGYNFVWIGGGGELTAKSPNVYHVKETMHPYKYYKLLDYFVLFSEHEPFGNVVIENLYLNNKVLTFKDNVYYDFKDKLTKDNYFEYPGRISIDTAIEHISKKAKYKKLSTNYKGTDANSYVVKNFTNYKEDFLKTLLAAQ